MAWLSLRAYAKHRGCTLSAVQRAIESGRLTASLGRDGRGHPKITDAAAADAEWAATTHGEKAPLAIQLREAARAPPTLAPPVTVAGGEDDRADGEPPPLLESRARREAAEAQLAEIELEEKRGGLVSSQAIDAELTTLFTSCRTKLLGVPSRARQQDPGFTADQLTLLESLIREALEDLSSPLEPQQASAA